MSEEVLEQRLAERPKKIPSIDKLLAIGGYPERDVAIRVQVLDNHIRAQKLYFNRLLITKVLSA